LRRLGICCPEALRGWRTLHSSSTLHHHIAALRNRVQIIREQVDLPRSSSAKGLRSAYIPTSLPQPNIPSSRPCSTVQQVPATIASALMTTASLSAGAMQPFPSHPGTRTESQPRGSQRLVERKKGQQRRKTAERRLELAGQWPAQELPLFWLQSMTSLSAYEQPQLTRPIRSGHSRIRPHLLLLLLSHKVQISLDTLGSDSPPQDNSRSKWDTGPGVRLHRH